MKFAVFTLCSIALVCSVSLARHSPATAADGAVTFSTSQAVLGTKTYARSCAVCHGAKLQGVSGPALIGKTSGIAQQSVTEVFEYVSQQMPMSAPGSLTKAQYLGVMAFLLQKNGHKAGGPALTEATATTSSATILAP